MVELKDPRAQSFLRLPGVEIRAVLIHGSDEGLVRERAKTVVQAVAGSLDDPFTVARLDDDVLNSDPGQLADESQAISLGGGRRVVWIRDGGSGTAKALAAYLPHASGDTLTVIESGNLKKSDKLRQLAERADNVVSIACYADSQANLRDLVEQSLARENVRISPDALEHFVTLLGGDRSLSRMEIEKLCLYGRGRGEITVADIGLISGDASGLAVDDFMDCVFEGDMPGADLRLWRLLAGGTAPAMLVISAANHLALLRRLRSQMHSGSDASTVVNNARPPIFYQRKAGLARQLSLWDLASLLSAGASVAECELKTRQHARLAEDLVGRLFLTLSRAAASRKARLR
ncbi:DNA polymerase-3 subunit delta [Rhodoligotrophos appendicifer]|uniref:DNA polymerase III subunit delta n=1 Tax=Rhodoligotrophos appendicifer TaxID=987056 RepID=UPI00117CEFBF|nr:DNA polymerase III subunit delta [Rhodoligotrophos appendicifer]